MLHVNYSKAYPFSQIQETDAAVFYSNEYMNLAEFALVRIANDEDRAGITGVVIGQSKLSGHVGTETSYYVTYSNVPNAPDAPYYRLLTRLRTSKAEHERLSLEARSPWFGDYSVDMGATADAGMETVETHVLLHGDDNSFRINVTPYDYTRSISVRRPVEPEPRSRWYTISAGSSEYGTRRSVYELVNGALVLRQHGRNEENLVFNDQALTFGGLTMADALKRCYDLNAGILYDDSSHYGQCHISIRPCDPPIGEDAPASDPVTAALTGDYQRQRLTDLLKSGKQLYVSPGKYGHRYWASFQTNPTRRAPFSITRFSYGHVSNLVDDAWSMGHLLEQMETITPLRYWDAAPVIPLTANERAYYNQRLNR